MELTFIGTGSGRTSLDRFHTSILITEKNHSLLIDTGDGIAKALLSAKVDFRTIDSILISHTHADHFSGITSLLTQMKIEGRTAPLKIFIHSAFLDFLNKFINVSFLFMETIGFELNIFGYEFNKPIRLRNDLEILPKQNSHIRNKDNFTNYNWLKFISSSFLIRSNSLNIFYTADIGSKNDLFLFDEYTIDYMITEATHITLSEIADAVKIINPQKCYLLHINDEELLKKEINKFSTDEKSKFELTHDGMRIVLNV
ncbi:hypothetical protein MNBD_IGNAVI01-2889 [hydrothermal vent metagenome]|uniref:Metallo-beta-lactamase domain-containing protein n=1 Tax=hydrothermal vent metagenome TaxID=652676 RepID=A0A3B1CDL7_9ZZZZ